ncbi:hypothetical protein ACFSUI_01205 [Ralstonia solanacearum]
MQPSVNLRFANAEVRGKTCRVAIEERRNRVLQECSYADRFWSVLPDKDSFVQKGCNTLSPVDI